MATSVCSFSHSITPAGAGAGLPSSSFAAVRTVYTLTLTTAHVSFGSGAVATLLSRSAVAEAGGNLKACCVVSGWPPGELHRGPSRSSHHTFQVRQLYVRRPGGGGALPAPQPRPPNGLLCSKSSAHCQIPRLLSTPCIKQMHVSATSEGCERNMLALG